MDWWQLYSGQHVTISVPQPNVAPVWLPLPYKHDPGGCPLTRPWMARPSGVTAPWLGDTATSLVHSQDPRAYNDPPSSAISRCLDAHLPQFSFTDLTIKPLVIVEPAGLGRAGCARAHWESNNLKFPPHLSLAPGSRRMRTTWDLGQVWGFSKQPARQTLSDTCVPGLWKVLFLDRF